MAYCNLPIGTSNPGCIVILVDQSWSMGEDWGTETKADGVALAVNRILNELVLAARTGDIIKDRCQVAVIGYGEQVERVVDSMISEIPSSILEVKKVKKSISDGEGGLVEVEVEMPIWLQPKASNGTPMHEAFECAIEIIQRWCDDNPHGFPPIVINITDGAANHPDWTADAARNVANLHTTDGNVLVFNIHIAKKKHEVIFPHNTDQFVGNYLAEYLYDLSSVLPARMRNAAKESGFPTELNARCFAYNAGLATIIKLMNFGSLDSATN